MPKINLMNFLRNYYGITDSNTFFESLSHEDLMELFPYKEECDDKSSSIYFMMEDLENLSCEDLSTLKEMIQSKNKDKCLLKQRRENINQRKDGLK